MSVPTPEPAAPIVTKRRSHAARARWKLTISMLRAYALGLIGLACLQTVIPAHQTTSWVILVEMGAASALMALAISVAPRGEE